MGSKICIPWSFCGKPQGAFLRRSSLDKTVPARDRPRRSNHRLRHRRSNCRLCLLDQFVEETIAVPALVFSCCKVSRAAHTIAEVGATPICSLRSVTHLVKCFSAQNDSACCVAQGVTSCFVSLTSNSLSLVGEPAPGSAYVLLHVGRKHRRVPQFFCRRNVSATA